ncbi:hypothetical protein [Desulfoluna spongiiphila]|uniref:Uncharacterized protein n=1 Tax=Desulfoluna spongiiphila TaxID=419481 RepID=A0A1G5F4W4_9BACT|nr:hypothetical protein [Desulfoluna spongiiphila]SCY34224.1 hypothetical protein SAMN05216233_107139 [Desulfoluna spongiiphila]
MHTPRGFFVLYQPPYRTPSVFDLNARRMFPQRPPVTRVWGMRAVVSEDLRVALQVLHLTEKQAVDPATGRTYPWAVTEILIDLPDDLALSPESLEEKIPDNALSQGITDEFTTWRTGYVPGGDNGSPDMEALSRKLQAGLAESKGHLRSELARRNAPWIYGALPRLVQDFKRGLYLRVADTLYPDYRSRGGEDTEEAFLKKAMLFQRIYDTNGTPGSKPDGTAWKDDDETWECWIGCAGDEEEAKRVCQTLEAILRPLEKTPTAQPG